MKNIFFFLLFALPTVGAHSQSLLQLDSSITFYGYGLNGSQDSTPLYRTVHTYPAADTELQVFSEYQGTEWATQTRTSLFYDDQGRLFEVLGETFDQNTQKFVPESMLSNFPRGNSPTLLDSFLIFRWETQVNDWERVLETRNVFNNEDKLQEAYTLFYGFGAPIEIKEVYTYDANGDAVLIESYALFDGQQFPSGKSELKYQNHLPVEVTAYVFDGLGFVAQSRITYAYTPFDSIAEVKSFEWDVDVHDWFNTETNTYTYYPNRLIEIKETAFFEKNLPPTREKTSYAYLPGSAQLLVEQFYLVDEQGNDNLLDKTYYYYRGATALPAPPSRVEAMALSPNPSTGTVQTNLPSDAVFSIFSADGGLLATQRVQPGQALELSAYPAGLYRVVAQTGEKVFVGSVVKQ